MAQVADLPARIGPAEFSSLGAMVGGALPERAGTADAQGRPSASFPPVGRLNPQAFGHRFILRR